MAAGMHLESRDKKNPASGTGRRRWVEVAGVLIVAVVVVLRFGSLLFSPVPGVDEKVYLRAFHDVSRGSSPYGHADPSTQDLVFCV